MIAQTTFAPDLPEPTDRVQGSILYRFRDSDRHWSRDDLVHEIGVTDRRIRHAIRDLRLAGWPITSHSDAGGYRLATTAEEVEACAREFEARGRANYEMASAVRRGKTILPVAA